MKKSLFGSLGQLIRGNAVIIILAVATVAAGVLSFRTVRDINNRLDNQGKENPINIQQPQSEEGENQPAQDVQNEANNVPLKPKTTAKPKATPAPKAEADESEATANNAEGVEKPDAEAENTDRYSPS